MDGGSVCPVGLVLVDQNIPEALQFGAFNLVIVLIDAAVIDVDFE